MGPADDHRRSKLDSVRSHEPLFHRISQDYLTKEAPQHFACEAEVFWVIVMGGGRTIATCSERRPGIDPLERTSVIRFERRKLEVADDALVR
jgi:hypothetical protein